MRGCLRTLLLASVLCGWVETQGRVGYDELRALGLNCTPHDTCERSRSRDLPNPDERSCACDLLCTQYDDCCVDGPVADPSAPTPFTCVEMRGFKGVFMVTRCPEGWSGERRSCEAPDDNSDPVGNLPVTDTERSITFRNIHCASCHGQSRNLVAWQLRLQFDSFLNGVYRGDDPVGHVLRDLVRLNDTWGVLLNGTNGTEAFFEASFDAAVPKNLQTKIRSCKLDVQSRCPDDWTDNEVRRKCLSYQGVLYLKDRGGEFRGAFRNAHCAICNGQNAAQLACKSSDPRSMAFDGITWRSFPMAFSVLVDISDRDDVAVGFTAICPEGQVYDVLFKKCRRLTCFSPDQVLQDNLCVDSNKTLSPEFVTCAQVLLSKEDFTLLQNESVFVPLYDRVYAPGAFRLWNNGVFVCAPEGSSRLSWKFSPAMGYVTIVCLSVSLFFLFLHILFFAVVPDWRNNLSSKNLTSLAASLFLAYLGFLVAQWHPLPRVLCLFLSAEMFYFYLSSFFWMNVMAFDVWRTLRMATRELRVNSGRQWCRYAVYALYGWLVPAAIVCGAFVFDFVDESDSRYKPRFGKHWCWFGSRDALLLFFALPLGVMMAANLMFFGSSAWMISTTTKATVKHTGSNRRNFRLYWKLAVMLGLSWSFAFLASYLNLETLWYVFVVLNCLKGVFIFLAFTCNGKVKRFVEEKIAFLTKRRAYRTASDNSAYNSNSTQPSIKTSSTDLKSKSVSSF